MESRSAYLITVCVIDHEGYGPQEYVGMIENHRHISGYVVETETFDIGEWHDRHPLNIKGTDVRAYLESRRPTEHVKEEK